VIEIFVVGQGVADYVLAPFLVVERIHLNPVEVMFAIAAFGSVRLRWAPYRRAARRRDWRGRPFCNEEGKLPASVS
jgi:hypothetical protein